MNVLVRMELKSRSLRVSEISLRYNRKTYVLKNTLPQGVRELYFCNNTAKHNSKLVLPELKIKYDDIILH